MVGYQDDTNQWILVKSKSKSKSKPQYKVKNWSEYDASLKQRGSLTFWLSPEVIEQWLNYKKTGRKGASNTYSNVAIELMATLSALYTWLDVKQRVFWNLYFLLWE